jgi:hypothetical protein
MTATNGKSDSILGVLSSGESDSVMFSPVSPTHQCFITGTGESGLRAAVVTGKSESVAVLSVTGVFDSAVLFYRYVAAIIESIQPA